MADLSLTAAKVALVEGDVTGWTKPAAAAITAGQTVQQDTNGKWALADASTSGGARAYGIALKSVAAGQALTAAGPACLVDLGDALAALAYDAAVYQSDTAGALADAAGTTSFIVGRVFSGWAATTADKLLRVGAAL